VCCWVQPDPHVDCTVRPVSFTTHDLHPEVCPACLNASPHLLDYVLETSDVNYFRCRSCTHVWTTSKYGAPIEQQQIASGADPS
jgi:hypothetical protein